MPKASGHPAFMKTKGRVLLAIGLLILAGCASTPETSDIRVQAGMSRDDLKKGRTASHCGLSVALRVARTGTTTSSSGRPNR